MPIDAKKRNLTAGILIKLALLILLALQIYGYARAEWESSTGIWNNITLLYKFPYSNKIMELARLGALALILLAVFAYNKYSAKTWVFILALFSFLVIYSAEAILSTSLSRAIYSGNLPIIYAMLMGFFLGRSKAIWNETKTLFPWLMTIYLILFLYEFITSFLAFGWVIYQNSSMMTYYAHFFWLTVAQLYISIMNRRRTLWVLPVMVVILAGAVFLRSRSWVIQAVLLTLVASLAMYRSKNKKNKKRFLAGLLTVILIVGVSIAVMTTYFGDFVDSLIQKGDVDSRSFQYIEMLEQVEPYKWIFGQGMNATYTSSLYGEYTFIDNEFFYMSFHYGVIFAIIYFSPYIAAVFGCIKRRKSIDHWFFSILLILLWIASVNGLSVFNRIHLDIKSFIMPFLAGHIYQTALDSAENGVNDENTIYSR